MLSWWLLLLYILGFMICVSFFISEFIWLNVSFMFKFWIVLWENNLTTNDIAMICLLQLWVIGSFWSFSVSFRLILKVIFSTVLLFARALIEFEMVTKGNYIFLRPSNLLTLIALKLNFISNHIEVLWILIFLLSWIHFVVIKLSFWGAFHLSLRRLRGRRHLEIPMNVAELCLDKLLELNLLELGRSIILERLRVIRVETSINQILGSSKSRKVISVA